MEIRRATPADSLTLANLAARLWEHDPAVLAPEFAALTTSPEAACFLAFNGENAIGFAQVQLRHDYVEGCDTSPVGFLEGIYADASHRLSGVGTQLLSACEIWVTNAGCTEFASDCELDNAASLAWHLHSGFAETGRTIWFAKKL